MITATGLAAELDLPAPTAEQAAVIEAPLEPSLVVAGAGSGKTETMAARVVYLVATGQVRPEQVLGLTFTRKAATALAQRIRKRLAVLQTLGPRLGLPAFPFGDPDVGTYHAFGGRLIADFGPLAGIEPAARVLTPTGAWQLARRVVGRWDGDLLTDLGSGSGDRAAARDLLGPGRPPDRRRSAVRRARDRAEPPAVRAAGAPAAGRPAQRAGRSRQAPAGPAMDPAVGPGLRAGQARAGGRRFRRPDADRRDPGSGPPANQQLPRGTGTGWCCSTSTRTLGMRSGSSCAPCSVTGTGPVRSMPIGAARTPVDAVLAAPGTR